MSSDKRLAVEDINKIPEEPRNNDENKYKIQVIIGTERKR